MVYVGSFSLGFSLVSFLNILHPNTLLLNYCKSQVPTILTPLPNTEKTLKSKHAVTGVKRKLLSDLEW